MNDAAPPPSFVWRRVAAFALDFLPILLLLDWATDLSDAGVLAVTSVLMLISAVAFAPPTPGKRVMGLKLDGQGCLACRELRRLWPVLSLGLGAFALEVAAGRGHVPSAAVISVATLVLVAGVVWTHFWPLSTGRELPHNLATGFRVTLA